MKNIRIYIVFFLIVLVSCTSLPIVNRDNLKIRGFDFATGTDETVLEHFKDFPNKANCDEIIKYLANKGGNNNLSSFIMRYYVKVYFNEDKKYINYEINSNPEKNLKFKKQLADFVWNRLRHNQSIITEYDIFGIKVINKMTSSDNANMILGSFKFCLGHCITGRLLFYASEFKSKHGVLWIVREIILPKRNSNNADDGIILYDYQKALSSIELEETF